MMTLIKSLECRLTNIQKSVKRILEGGESN